MPGAILERMVARVVEGSLGRRSHGLRFEYSKMTLVLLLAEVQRVIGTKRSSGQKARGAKKRESQGRRPGCQRATRPDA